MNEVILSIVDYWIESKPLSWLNTERIEIVERWRVLSYELRNPEVGPNRKGYEAALRGILLELVRQAWNDPYAYVMYRRGMPRLPWVFVHEAARKTGPKISEIPVWVTQVADERGVRRPVTIAMSPVSGKKSRYQSIAIFLDLGSRPEPALLELLKRRSFAYAKRNSSFKILGFRLIKRTLLEEEESV